MSGSEGKEKGRSTGGGRGRRGIEGGRDNVWSSSLFHKYFDKNWSEEKFFPI